MSTTYNLESNDYEIKMSSNGMDSTISNLKTKLFDLEQQEKDYDALRQKLEQLKKDHSILSKTKNKLEQELKQRDDSYNQRIANLRGENENLQLSYNEKLALNKKLFTENDELEKEIEARDAEIEDLKNKLRNLNNQLNQSLGDKGDLENQVQKLKNIKNSQLNEINKLTNENKNLNNIVNDQNKRLQQAQEDIDMLNNKSNQNQMDIQNLDGKLRNLIDDINNTQNALNKNNLENRDLDDRIRNLECQCNNLKCENNNLNNNIIKEKALRGEKERQNQQLTDAINDHDNQIGDLENKYNTITSLYEQVSTDSKMFQNNNDKLKQHIMLLTQQNQKLLGELEKVKDQDMRIKTLLSRKDQSCMLLRGVQSCIEQATVCLEKVESDPLGYSCNNLRNSGERERVRVNSSEHYRSSSPTYSYMRKEDA
jgi:chromosome segregation ATPase